MDTGFGAWQLYTACKLVFTHYYESGDKHSKRQGTGFIVEFPNTATVDETKGIKTPGPFGLVTNRHLVDIPWAKPAFDGTMLKLIELEWWQSQKMRLGYAIPDPTPLYHEDETIDVAIVPLGPFDSLSTRGTAYGRLDDILSPDAAHIEFKHALSWQYLLMCEGLWSELRPGELVSFPGYPKWYDKLQTRPVFRSGMIASDPQTDYRLYEGEPRIGDGNPADTVRRILFKRKFGKSGLRGTARSSSVGVKNESEPGRPIASEARVLPLSRRLSDRH